MVEAEKTEKRDAEEVMAVYDALVVAFNILDDTDAITRRPTLRVLAQDIADLADRAKALSLRCQKSKK